MIPLYRRAFRAEFNTFYLCFRLDSALDRCLAGSVTPALTAPVAALTVAALTVTALTVTALTVTALAAKATEEAESLKVRLKAGLLHSAARLLSS